MILLRIVVVCLMQGPPLAANLRLFLTNQPLLPFVPQVRVRGLQLQVQTTDN